MDPGPRGAVSAPAPRDRPRPRSLRSGAFFVFLACGAGLSLVLFGGVTPLGAQEPDTIPAPDTLPAAEGPQLRPEPPDTAGRMPPVEVIAQDSTPADTLGPPPPRLPEIEPVGPATWARGVWEWDREELRRFPGVSLLEFLERLPGVVPVRADVANQPEAAAVFGATAGATRYVVDGFEVDPLVTPTFDPSRLALLGLESVRVERRITGATVHLRTLSPDHPRPRTIIEAGTGDFDVQLFRGMFLAPSVLGGPLALGFERLASDGAIGGSSNHLQGWLKWSWVRDSAGVQLEYRQSDMDRSGVGMPLRGARRDWVVRARAARGPLTGEVYAGASNVEDQLGDIEDDIGDDIDDTDDIGSDGILLREGSPHAGLRVGGAFDGPVPVEARTAVRLRDHPRLPFGEVELAVRALPVPGLALEAEAVRGWWDEGPATGRWAARVQAGPLMGVTVFSEVFQGAPLLADGVSIRTPATAGDPIRVTRDGIRVGAELRYGGLALAGAALRTSADLGPAFGLPMEGSQPRLSGGEVNGIEAMARIPTGWDPVSIQGWYVGIDDPAGWLYLPRHNWRAAMVYHHLPLPSGNLEISARAEHVFRGRMLVPGVPDPDAEDVPDLLPAEVGSYRASNLEITIRVLTVQAFIRWENILNRRAQRDLPGFTHPGQNVLYGVKWEFLN